MRSNFILSKDQGLPPLEQLGFGKYYSPYIYVRRFRNNLWEEPIITDYQYLEVDPASEMLHYGQLIFEGMKAYYNESQNKVYLFRPYENAKRYIRSAARLCMPELPVEDFVESVLQAVKFSKKWIPPFKKESNLPTSLYIRPFFLGTTPKLGVKPAEDYAHIVITSPSGPYFATGIKPVRLKVEEQFVRAVPGGTGMAKCAGNYAGSLLADTIAKKEGFQQVLWLDAIHRKYLEEVGAMNVFVIIDGKLITPKLTGSILPGITRKSIIEIGKKYLNLNVEERDIAIDEVIEAQKAGKLQEMFGSGTAAVVTPIGIIGYKGKEYTINDNTTGEITRKIYDTLLSLQYGEIELPFAKDWVVEVKDM